MNNTIAIVCILLPAIVTITHAEQTSEKLKWEVKPTPAHFKQTVKLVCIQSYEMCFYNKTRKWSGGKQFNEIALNNTTSNATKYTVKTESCSEYSLYIHNFSEEDINCSYSCEIGFYEYRHILSINDYAFEYIPGLTNIHRDIFYQKAVLHLHIHVSKVYPIPTCVIRFLDKNLTYLSRSYPKKTGSLYQLDVKLNVMLEESQCNGRLFMSCSVGNSDITVIDRMLDDCSEPTFDRNSNNIAERLPFLLGVLFGICLIIISIPLYGKVREMLITPTVIARNKTVQQHKNKSGNKDTELIELTEHHSPSAVVTDASPMSTECGEFKT